MSTIYHYLTKALSRIFTTTPNPPSSRLITTKATTKMAQKVKTRILIISDTHNRPLQNDKEPKRPFREPLPAADVLIHCGDLTMYGSLKDYHATLDAIKHVDAPLKLVIAGNHDLTLDNEWMRAHQGDQRISHLDPGKQTTEAFEEFWKGENGRARREGVTFLDEGVHGFDLVNGARLTVYASPYTPDFYDWGFAYKRNEDRFNKYDDSLEGANNIAENPVPSFEEQQVDVMITHGPPYKRMDLTASGTFAGCHHLLRALMRCRPLIHCFGHIHEGWGAEVVSWADGAREAATGLADDDAWKKEGWKEGVKGDGGIVSVVTDMQKAKKERSVYVDGREGGEQELARGKQTLLVNAAIVDVGYAPVNAPILVDVDLELRN